MTIQLLPSFPPLSVSLCVYRSTCIIQSLQRDITPCRVIIESHSYTNYGYLFHFTGSNYQFQSMFFRQCSICLEYTDYITKNPSDSYSGCLASECFYPETTVLKFRVALTPLRNLDEFFPNLTNAFYLKLKFSVMYVPKKMLLLLKKLIHWMMQIFI